MITNIFRRKLLRGARGCRVIGGLGLLTPLGSIPDAGNFRAIGGPGLSNSLGSSGIWVPDNQFWRSSSLGVWQNRALR